MSQSVKMSVRLCDFFAGFFCERFFRSEGRNGLNRCVNWWSLFLISTAVFIGVLISNGGPLWEGDTESYIRAATDLAHGELNLLRTPGYPALILLFNTLFGSAGLTVLSILQQLLFLLSVMILRHILGITGIGRRTSILLTAFYLFLPDFKMWFVTAMILTESLSFFLFMVLSWLSVRSIINPRSLTFGTSLWMDFLIFLLIAIRPGNIYLIALYAMIWLCVCFSRRWKTLAGIAGLAGLLLVSGAVWSYRLMIKQRFDYEGITIVSFNNNYHFVRQFGLLKPEYVDNPELRRILDECGAYSDADKGKDLIFYWGDVSRVIEIDPCYVEINRVVQKAMFADPAATAGALFYRMFPTETTIDRSTDPWWRKIISALSPNISFTVVFMLVCFAVIIALWIRSRRFSWLTWYLWGMTVACQLTAVIGAMSDWGRLTFGVFPLILLMLAEFWELARHGYMDAKYRARRASSLTTP